MNILPIRDDALEQRFIEYVNELQPPLMRYVCSLCQDRCDAEEICWDTFRRLHEALEKGTLKKDTPIQNVKYWIRFVARNLNIDRFRRLQRKPPFAELPDDSADRLRDPSSSPEEDLLKDELSAQVRAAAEKLPPTERACLLLWLEGYRLREIGELLNLDVRRVSENLIRAKRRLRSDLKWMSRHR